MLPTGNLLVLCVLAGSSYAVFYTKSSHNEYPRIGRRAFYTSGNGYPRIGRRDSSGSGGEMSGKSLSSAAASSAGFPDLREALEKRGLYTSSGGYPRVGRSGANSRGGVWQYVRANLLRNMAALEQEEEEEEEEEMATEEDKDERGNGYGLEIMFMTFDQNDDNQLSKEEFTEGMQKYRQQNPLC